MFKLFIPAVALMVLVAFGARTETPGMAVTAEAGMAWHLSHEGDMAKLAYGIANSDQLSLMMTCAPGDRTAAVYGEVQPDTPRLMAVNTGPSEPDPISGGEATESRIALNDAALGNLARKGVMKVTGMGGKYSLAADIDERRLVSGFIAHCATGRA